MPLPSLSLEIKIPGMKLKQKFSDADLQRIKAAVKSAEDKISGEIVPVIVDRSGSYTIANYKGSLIGAAFSFVLMILLDRYVIEDATNTLYYDPVFIFFMVVLGAVIGGMLPHFFEPVKRWLIDQAQLDECTRQRAENAFLEEEIF